MNSKQPTKAYIRSSMHCWLIKNQILAYSKHQLEGINGAEGLARQLKQLAARNSLAPSSTEDYFAATQFEVGFQAVVARLFGEKVQLVNL
jgi:hypothetical protein